MVASRVDERIELGGPGPPLTKKVCLISRRPTRVVRHILRLLTRLPSVSIWLDERILPAYVAAVSFLVLAIQAVVHTKPVQKLFKSTSQQDAQPQGTWLSKRGGPVIFAFKLVRLAIVVAVFVVTLVSSFGSGWHWYSSVLASTLVRLPSFAPNHALNRHQL